MRAAQLMDMSGARVNVVHMSKMIQIRNVPDEMHRALKAGGREGMSLSDYIKRELGGGNGRKSTLEEIDARSRASGPARADHAGRRRHHPRNPR